MHLRSVSSALCPQLVRFAQRRQQSAAAAASAILVERDTDITLIGIDRERTRNCIDSATAQQLSEAISAFENDDTSPVGVLYGVGGSFCAGYDLGDLEKRVEQRNFDFLFQKEGAVGPTRRHLRKPLVCAINGFCVGSGFELALLCDFRVMENTAVLGFFNRRFGVPITNGGTVRLAASVGYSRALDIILTGRRVGGAEALEIGLISRLVATGTALGQAVNLAFSIAKFPPASLQHDRSSLYTNAFDETKGFRRSAQNEIMQMSHAVLAEMQEGARRFMSSAKKGAKTDSWNIKEKPVPDWERAEIAREQRHQESP